MVVRIQTICFLYFKKNADLIYPKLAKIFHALLTSGSFPELWRIANVIPISKGNTPTQFLHEYRPIARRLYKFANAEKKLLQTQFGFRKGLLVQQMLCYCSHIICRHYLIGVLNQG